MPSPPWTRRFSFPFRLRRRIELEVDEEIAFHLEMRTEDLIRKGVDPQEARRRAAAEFGDLDVARRTLRESDEAVERGTRRREWLGGVVLDLRYARRSLVRNPGFSIAAVLTLALGIGAATTIFTAVKRIVLDPLPYPAADRLVRLKSQVPGVAPGEEWQLSAAQYYFVRDNARTIEEIGVVAVGPVSATTPAGAVWVNAGIVSSSTMRLVGARPALGRSLDSGDDNPSAERVAVISHGFWRDHFDTDPAVLERTIELVGIEFRIVGVLAPGAELPPEPGAPFALDAHVWVTRGAVDPSFTPDGPFQNNHVIPTIARLAPGVTLEEAQLEMEILTGRLGEAFPGVYPASFLEESRIRMVVFPLKAYVVGAMAGSLWVLFGAAGLLLLIAGVNVSGLLLARADSRRGELAIRGALGASRIAIARQFVLEGAMLALAAGTIGLVLSIVGSSALTAIAPPGVPRLAQVRPDGGVALFALLVSLAVAGAIPLAPVLRSTDRRTRARLADGDRATTAGPERHRARSALLIVQVALAVVLLVTAGLLVESYRSLRALEPGIDPRGVLTTELSLPVPRYTTHAEIWDFHRDALERIRAIPGVIAAGTSSTIPFRGGYGCTVQGFDDPAVAERLTRMELTTCAGQEVTTPGYFEAMGIPLLLGRTLTDADSDHATPAVVVSRSFADRFWPGEDPIGKGVSPSGTRPPFYRVVGVVGDVYSTSPTEDPAIVIYYPHNPPPGVQSLFRREAALAVRTNAANPLSLLPSIRAAIADVDPGVALGGGEAMTAIVARSMSRTTFSMIVILFAATMALVLAAVGLYGVVSFVVGRRRAEIAVRLAIGARPGQVERQVVGRALLLTCVGLTIGLGGALAGARIVESLVYDRGTVSVSAYLAAAVAVLSVAALASYLPARRASRTDPVSALRGG